jgi:hypothetical protein
VGIIGPVIIPHFPEVKLAIAGDLEGVIAFTLYAADKDIIDLIIRPVLFGGLRLQGKICEVGARASISCQ